MPYAGSATSSTLDLFHTDTSTTEALSTLAPPISTGISNATSSQELVAGPTRSNSRTGPKIGKSGRDHVHVSRFRALDNIRDMPTNDTSGPLFNTLSPSASLQQSLESKLRARMGENGCQGYELTWRQWDMPSGPPICALRASVRRRYGNGFIGWQTPKARGDDGFRWTKREAWNLGDQVRIFALNRGLTTQEVHQLCLSPTFVCRLMGFPTEWLNYTVLETQSSRKSLRSS